MLTDEHVSAHKQISCQTCLDEFTRLFGVRGGFVAFKDEIQKPDD
jgi:hypothetical protein